MSAVANPTGARKPEPISKRALSDFMAPAGFGGPLQGISLRCVGRRTLFLCGPTTLLGAAYNTKRESRKVEKRRKAAASPKMVPVRALRQAAAPALLIPVVGKIIRRAIEHSRPRPIPLRCFEPLLQAPTCPEAHEPTHHASLKFASTSHSSWKSPIIAKSSCLTQHVYLNEVDLVEDHSS